MKSTWFGSRARYDFARLVTEADYGTRTYELFGAFLECAAMSLKQAVHKFVHNVMCDKIEESVCAIQRRLKYPQKFSQAMGALVAGLEDEPGDFLGATFMEIGAADSAWRGQCFTPNEVCKLMAMMTTGNVSPIDGKTLTFNDPACGGGAMLIATSMELRARGFCPWHYHWHANDIDKRCFNMTYVQTTLLGIPAVVHHANTITMECWESKRNLISVMHPEKKTRQAAPEVEQKLVDVLSSGKKSQATLF